MRTSRLLRLCALVPALAAAGCAPVRAAPVPAPQAASGTLVVLGTTDVHGWLLPYDYYTGKVTTNGLVRVAPLIDSIRAAHPGHTLLIDSGDLLQGNPLDFVYSRLEPGEEHPVARAMNALGYDAAAIGNHEFNYGIAHLDTVVAQASFPFLSANIFRAGSDEHAYRPYMVVEREIGGRRAEGGHHRRDAAGRAPLGPRQRPRPAGLPRRGGERAPGGGARCAPRARTWWWWPPTAAWRAAATTRQSTGVPVENEAARRWLARYPGST